MHGFLPLLMKTRFISMKTNLKEQLKRYTRL